MKVFIYLPNGLLTGYYFDYNLPTISYGFVALETKSYFRAGRSKQKFTRTFPVVFVESGCQVVPAIKIKDNISCENLPEYFERIFGISIKVIGV